jgi:hypothetical protein
MRICEVIAEATANNIAVFYGGRFQPMHQGHYQLYQQLVKRFGAGNVFIATTFGQKQQKMHTSRDYSTDPFTFAEKTKIASQMFGINPGVFVDTQPYKPDLSKIGRDPNNTAVILAFSEKDAGRLREGGALRELPDDLNQLEPASSKVSYFVSMPVNQGGMSATDFRKIMASQADAQEKRAAFTRFFGTFDQQVFNFIQERLTNG